MKKSEYGKETVANNKSAAMTKEQEQQFVKAMKIGYYKEFYNQGLITAEQLEKLISIQENPVNKYTA